MRSSLLLCVVLVGCAENSSGGGSHVDLVSDSYTLQPGDEKYFCYTMTLPAGKDLAITKLTPTYGAATHHILIAQTLVDEPAGFSECPVLIRQSWLPLYGGGKDSGPLEMPASTGMKMFKQGQQILMQLHLQNATDAPITAKTAMRIDYTEITPDLVPAGIYGFDNRKLTIPAHTEAAVNEMSCKIDRDLDVFAIMGHMHKHGVHLDVSRGAAAGAEMLYDEAWSFETQPVTPLVMRVSKGDNVFLRCTHRNDSATPLMYGESSDTEMCSFLMYYTPFEALDGCLND